MEIKYPKLGSSVVARITNVKGKCSIGMKPGDEFDLSIHKCGNFCGYFYHNIFGWINLLQFGGSFPLSESPDKIVCECSNSKEKVTIKLIRSND